MRNAKNFGPHPGHHPHQSHPGRHPRPDEFGFGAGGFGPDFPFGPGRGRPRGRRRGGRGGDVRAAALLLLSEQPRHGYDLIQEIGDRSEGAWTPSPGSIYPVLQQLEDEGLVEFERVDGRKTASLTETGTAYVEEHRESLGEPWNDAQRPRRNAEVRELAQGLRGFMEAWKQVATHGTPEQQKAAGEAVDDARKALYRILAD